MKAANVFDIIMGLLQEQKISAAELLSYRMLNGSMVLYIADGDSSAYNTGLADYLQNHTYFTNTKNGFRAYLTK